jgi:hypothetical protein
MSREHAAHRGYKVIGTVIICLTVWYILIPAIFAIFTPPHRRLSPYTIIIPQLKQVELSKQLWAEDHHATNGTLVSTNDLQGYVGASFSFVKLWRLDEPVAYQINAIGEPPFVVLESDSSALKFPKGTLFRHAGTTGVEVKLPQSENWETIASARQREVSVLKLHVQPKTH